MTHYVQLTKCLTDTKHMHDPNQVLIVLNKIIRLKGIPKTYFDSWVGLLEAHYTVAFDKYVKTRIIMIIDLFPNKNLMIA